MSTHRRSLRGHRNACVPLFLVCCGLLLALQLQSGSPSVALASTAHTLAVSAPPTLNPTAPTDQGFALARVAVVRLLVSYVTQDTKQSLANCTGLGVLVKSLPPSGDTNRQNDWILTDGSLLNSTQPTCASNGPAGTLSQIQISLNTTYNSTSPPTIQLDGNSTPPLSKAIMCPDTANPTNLANCNNNNGLAFLSFQGKEVPFVDLARPSERAPGNRAIALTDASGKFPNANTDSGSATGFLTPQLRDPKDLELGTPLIDPTTGHLTDLHLAGASSPITLESLSSLIDSNPAFSSNTGNPVDTSWKAGIGAYYQRNYANAQKDFQQAFDANPNFQGANDFKELAKNAGSTLPSTSTPASPQTGVVIPFLNVSLEWWQLGLLILLLLVLVSLLIIRVIRSRMEKYHPGFSADLKQANREAAARAKEVEELEAVQREWALHNRTSERVTLTMQQQGFQDKTVMRKTVRDMPCPQCGEPVARDANFCPNCRMLLSPSESGFHLRVRPPASSAQPSMAPVPFANSVAGPPPPVLMTPMSPLPEEQTTQPSLPPLSESSIDAVAAHPTIEIEPGITWKRSGRLQGDTTLPYAVQPVQGKRLGFIVGTRSDPGLKRKYKPNEDSLLAAQGLVSGPPGPQPFGLFVIADGMGGHANGQDASRLAIQKIVENILPRLVNNGAGSIDYAQVLVDGIQSANLAVHQENMEKRGDMGTTLTSALVVGPTAYVANVGDSRTYLYHAPDGLQKVTIDHSVVASLVEAGIIKPDDIYTHPKRNQIYRSLGEKANVEIDLFTQQLQEGDKLLLCSDGLWDMVRDPKIEEVIKRPVADPSMTGEDLIKSALDGGGEDNVSVIVVQITEGKNPEDLPRVKLLAMPESVQMPQF